MSQSFRNPNVIRFRPVLDEFVLNLYWFLEFFRDGYHRIFTLPWPRFIGLFWGIFFLELPRYLIADVYAFFDQFTYRWFRREERAQYEDHRTGLLENPPPVSVIVPVLNEEETIRDTVVSIREQSYSNIEIIVVDDGSTDNTQPVCKRMEERDWIRYFRFQERQGKSPALNHGLRYAESDFIVFMDSDCTLDRHAILNAMTCCQDPNVGAVAGNLAVRNQNQNILTTLQSLEYLLSITIGRIFRSKMGILPIVSGAFGVFYRKEIERAGGHEPGPGNDSDLAIRIRKLGRQITFAHNATTLTNVPSNLWSLIKQRMRWNRNIVRNRVRKHNNVFDWHSQGFSWPNFLSFVDTLFYSGVLSFLWLIYIIQIIIVWPSTFPIIYSIIFIILFLSRSVQFLIGLYIVDYANEILPTASVLIFYGPYKVFLRLVRITAYIQELLYKSSYEDPFAPEKVRGEIPRF